MIAKEILDTKGRKSLFIIETASILEVAAELTKNKIGLLIVNNSAGDITGVISERDIVGKVLYFKKDCAQEQVKSVMTPKEKLFVASENDNIQSIMNSMTKNKIRHVLVFNGKVFSGIISIGDIVNSMLEEKEFEIKTLNDYISGKYPA